MALPALARAPRPALALLPADHPARRYLSVLGLIALWQAGSALGLISPRILAAPSAIVATAWDLLLHGGLIGNLLVSLARAATGFAIGATVGGSLALIAGLSRAGEDMVDAPMQMLRTLPFLALVPLFILWFGIGETPKIVLVAFGAAFPVYLNLFAAIRGIDPKLVEAGRICGLSRRALIAQVVLPGAMPGLLTGLRFALGIAWLSLVVAEQINASSGIGFMINDARDFLRTDVIVVGLLVYALLGLTSDSLVRMIERRAFAWRPSLVRA